MAKSQGMRIMMPVEGYEKVKELADEQRKPIADLVREAIELYMKDHGVEVDLRMKRGGYRGNKD